MGLIILGIFLGIVATVSQFLIVAILNDDYDVKNGRTPRKKVSKGLAVALFIGPVVFFTGIASTVRVDTGEIAVMTRFGNVTGEELGQGFHFKNPVDDANIYDVKVIKDQTKATAASKDLQDVNADLVINYRLEPGKIDLIHQNVGLNYKQKIIDPAIQEVFKETTAKYNATVLITNRPEVKDLAEKTLRERLLKYGIIIQAKTGLSIVDITFSEEFSKSIEDKQVAFQNSQRAKYNLVQAKLDAESQRVQKETLTATLLRKQELENQREAIKKWNGILPTTVAGNGQIFNIPTKK